MAKYFGLYCSLFFFALYTLGQNPSDYFDAYQANLPFLEHLVKTKIDSVRTKKDLKPLYNDSILYLAANDHANYLQQKKVLSHYQNENTDKRTPHKRVLFYKGQFFSSTAENIAKTFYHKPMKNKKGKAYTNNSYQDIANDLIQGWVNSPGHYKNIMTPEFNLTGVCLALNPEEEVVYAVQVFGKQQFIYTYNNNDGLFPYAHKEPEAISIEPSSGRFVKNKWNIGYFDSSCYDCSELATKAQNFMKLEYQGNNVYLVMESGDLMRELISNKKDGVQLELVSYEPYDKGNPAYTNLPSRRNHLNVYNGTGQKPLYYKDVKRGYRQKKQIPYEEKLELLKDTNSWVHERYPSFIKSLGYRFKKQWQGGYWRYKIGVLDGNGLYEPNVLILHENKLCQVLRFTNYCGDTLNFAPQDTVSLPYHRVRIPFTPKSYFFFKSVRFKPYGIEVDSNSLHKINAELNEKGLIITRLEIEASASVEGNEAVNERLSIQRAQALADKLQSKQSQKFAAEIRYHDSWKMFRAQLHESEKFDYLDSVDVSVLKSKLSETAFRDSVTYLLNEQRYAKLHLYAIEDTSKHLSYLKSVQTRYNQLHRLLSKVPVDEVVSDSLVPYFDTLVAYQNKIHDLCAQYHWEDEANTSALEHASFWPIRLNNYTYFVRKNQFNFEEKAYSWLQFYCLDYKSNRIVELPNAWKLKFVALYLLQYEQGIKDDDFDLEDLESFLYSIKNITQSDTDIKNHLKACIWHFMVYALKDKEADEAKREKYLLNLFDFYRNQTLNQAELENVAKFFIDFGANAYAYSLIEPVVQNESCTIELLKMYLELKYHYNGLKPQKALIEEIIAFKSRMPITTWCNLFTERCMLSFQLFDDAQLRAVFCSECAEKMEDIRRLHFSEGE